MSSPIRMLENAVDKTTAGALYPYSLMDSAMLSVTLGLFERAGIEIAVLKVIDEETQVPVRFDSAHKRGGVELWECINEGKMFLYFDSYEMVALITKSIRRRFIFFNKIVYTPHFSTPVSSVLTGPVSLDFDDALEWVERRYKRALEVIPTLLDK